MGSGNLQLLLDLPRALRATACGAQRSANVSGGQWLSVTGESRATNVEVSQQAGSQGLCGSPVIHGKRTATPNRAGEASKES